MQEVTRIDLDGVNCYLGKQDNKFVLFDTGGHIVMDKQFNNRYDALVEQLNEHGCTSENLMLIVLTPGSIAILTANGDLICGDTLANNKNPEMAPNAFDFGLLKKSVDRIKSTGVKMVFPGHGNPFELKDLK